MKKLLPFFSKNDLKTLKLANKWFEYKVVQLDERMQTWLIKLTKPNAAKTGIRILNQSSCKDIFQLMHIKLHLGEPVFSSIKKDILKVCWSQIVLLNIWISKKDKFSLANFLEEQLCLPKLEKLHVAGQVSSILNNESIARSVKYVTVKFPDHHDSVDIQYPKLEHVVLNDCVSDFSEMISPQVKCLFMPGTVDDYYAPWRLANVKILMVDGLSADLLYKCSDSVELLILNDDEFIIEDEIPQNLKWPKLKHLIFGWNCDPLWDVIRQHKSSLETIMMPVKYNKKELFKIKKVIKQFPCLKRVVLPPELEGKVTDDSGKVEIIYKKDEAVKMMKVVGDAVCNDVDEEFFHHVYDCI